jgi:hypothetical protein
VCEFPFGFICKNIRRKDKIEKLVFHTTLIFLIKGKSFRITVIQIKTASFTNRKEGSLGPAELSVLSSWYDWLETNLSIHLDLIVYLRSFL